VKAQTSRKIRMRYRRRLGCAGQARRTNDRILRRRCAQKRERSFGRRLVSRASCAMTIIGGETEFEDRGFY